MKVRLKINIAETKRIWNTEESRLIKIETKDLETTETFLTMSSLLNIIFRDLDVDKNQPRKH